MTIFFKRFRSINSYLNRLICIIIDKIDSYDKELETEKSKLKSLSLKIVVVSEFFNLFITLIVFFLGVFFVMNNEMTMGQLMAFVQLLMFANYPLKILPQLITKYAASKEIIRKNHIEIENKDLKNDSECYIGGNIEYKNVSFGYVSSANVLNDINFIFEKGKIYAIVGLSGSGKTTLTNLLQNKYDNYLGDIFIGNKNIRNIDNIYNYFSVIQQDSFVLDDTIINNITMYNNYN